MGSGLGATDNPETPGSTSWFQLHRSDPKLLDLLIMNFAIKACVAKSFSYFHRLVTGIALSDFLPCCQSQSLLIIYFRLSTPNYECARNLGFRFADLRRF